MMDAMMGRRAFIRAVGLGTVGGAACARTAMVRANTSRDGINYTQYGGYADLDFAGLGGVYVTPPNVGCRLGKIGTRWVFVDPLGKVCLVRGQYKVHWDNPHTLGGGQQAGRSLGGNIVAKYGGTPNWNAPTRARLQRFHYNWVGSASVYLGAIFFSTTNNASANSMQTSTSAAGGLSEPVKNLLEMLPAPGNFGGSSWGRMWGDHFDPKFTQFVASNQVWGYQFAGFNNPYVIFFQSDDGDFISAQFGAGAPNEVGMTDQHSDWVAHGGALALISNPGPITSQTGSGLGTRSWSIDTLNHTKRFLLDRLTAKYGTIGALNTAWGTAGYYTAFESAGGYGVGTGLADEDGRRPRTWFGSNSPAFFFHAAGRNNVIDSTTWGLAGTFTGGIADMKIDLDGIQQSMIEAYLKPNYDEIHRRQAGALYIGSTGMGTSSAPPRAPVLKAFGRYTDLMMGGGFTSSDPTTYMNFIRANLGADKPMIHSIYNPCNPDGCLYYLGAGSDTQAARGQRTASLVNGTTAYQDPSGIYPFLGYIEWGLYGQPEEGADWGVFSYNDNPYDGGDYRVARPDPYNPQYTTLTEDRVYGDTITSIKNAHIAMFTTLQTQFGR